jgi:hypothetical protein
VIADSRMNEKAKAVHAANADRIQRERHDMADKWRIDAEIPLEFLSPDTRQRNCLCCDAPFQSTGNGHRLCSRCRRLEEGL